MLLQVGLAHLRYELIVRVAWAPLLDGHFGDLEVTLADLSFGLGRLSVIRVGACDVLPDHLNRVVLVELFAQADSCNGLQVLIPTLLL